MTPQLPPCGCTLTYAGNHAVNLTYCPLHLATERLRNALEYEHELCRTPIHNEKKCKVCALLRETGRGTPND